MVFVLGIARVGVIFVCAVALLRFFFCFRKDGCAYVGEIFQKGLSSLTGGFFLVGVLVLTRH